MGKKARYCIPDGSDMSVTTPEISVESAIGIISVITPIIKTEMKNTNLNLGFISIPI